MAIKILYAENDEFARKFDSCTLKELGFKVDVAEDGQEAWEAYQKGKYDLLLLDGQMPNKTGEEVMRLVRAQGDHIAIVIYSSMPDYNLLFDGIDECIEKGCSPEELQQRILAAYERSLSKRSVDNTPPKKSWGSIFSKK